MSSFTGAKAVDPNVSSGKRKNISITEPTRPLNSVNTDQALKSESVSLRMCGTYL